MHSLPQHHRPIVHSSDQSIPRRVFLAAAKLLSMRSITIFMADAQITQVFRVVTQRLIFLRMQFIRRKPVSASHHALRQQRRACVHAQTCTGIKILQGADIRRQASGQVTVIPDSRNTIAVLACFLGNRMRQIVQTTTGMCVVKIKRLVLFAIDTQSPGTTLHVSARQQNCLHENRAGNSASHITHLTRLLI
jgi:hypothetical protein